jgi:predicted GNAT family acetyltransferase
MSHILDRPIWSALATGHASLAEGGPLARRYPAAVSAFAATGDDDPESLDALARLVRAGETAFLVHSGDIVVPNGLERTLSAELVQMVADGPIPTVVDERIQPLTEADAQEMLDLALLTKPGPFTLRAQNLGAFWGIKIDGRLAAMAGQRLRQTGYIELSGVCSHPDFRGRGLGRLLSLYAAGKIIEQGARPYLHSYATNGTAIRLYEAIGFCVRSTMNGAVVQRLE